jgi:hypothetical protein
MNSMADMYTLENAEAEEKITVDATSFENVDYESLYNAAKKFIEG